MSKKLAESLGEYLGEYLIPRLPSLSCDEYTRNIIQVTIGEADELKRLHQVWMNKREVEEYRLTKGLKGAERYIKELEANKLSEDEWNNLLKYRYVLKEKYLPHTLKISIPYIDFSSEKTNKYIKDALINTLWNWDFCDWSLKEKDIIFENEVVEFGRSKKYNYSLAYVTLKLGLEPPASFTGSEWIEIKTPQKKI